MTEFRAGGVVARGRAAGAVELQSFFRSSGELLSAAVSCPTFQ